MTTQKDWPSRLTRSIAGEIQRRRKARGWSAQRLADECGKLGMDIPRSLITDLEIGRRAHLSVAELLVIARALDAPPLLLVFPVGTEHESETLPGQVRPAWRAAQWFTGEGPFPGPDSADLLTFLNPWNSGTAWPLVLYRAHDQAAEERLRAEQRAAELSKRAKDAATDAERDALLEAVAAQRRVSAQAQEYAGRLRAEAEAQELRAPDPIMRIRIPQADG